jgi:hypothetical protein
MQRKIILFVAIMLIVVVASLLVYYGRMEARAVRQTMQQSE